VAADTAADFLCYICVLNVQSVTSSGAVLLIADVVRPNGIITGYKIYVNSTLVRSIHCVAANCY